jgi:hypothetical protein
MKDRFIISEKKWESISTEERELAISKYQYFICSVSGLNYITLRYGVFDPSNNDLIKLIAVFNDIEHAKLFVNSL